MRRKEEKRTKEKKNLRLSWIEKKVLVTVFRFRFQVSSMCHIWIGISGFVVNHPSMRESVQGSNDTPTSFHVIIYIESDRIRLSSWFALNCYERDIENLNDQTPAIIQAWLCEVISFSKKLWFHSLDTRSSDMQGRSSKWTHFIAKGGSVNSLSSGIFKLRDLYDLILVSSCHSKANKPHVLLLEAQRSLQRILHNSQVGLKFQSKPRSCDYGKPLAPEDNQAFAGLPRLGSPCPDRQLPAYAQSFFEAFKL